MAIKDQLRRRLVTGLAGALVAGSLLVGAVAVAADDNDAGGQASRDDNAVQYARDTTGAAVASESTLTINSVVAAPAPSVAVAPAAGQDVPVAAPNDGRDDFN